MSEITIVELWSGCSVYRDGERVHWHLSPSFWLPGVLQDLGFTVTQLESQGWCDTWEDQKRLFGKSGAVAERDLIHPQKLSTLLKWRDLELLRRKRVRLEQAKAEVERLTRELEGDNAIAIAR